MSETDNEPTNGSGKELDDAPSSPSQLNCYQRGAAITNSGKHPIAGLTPEERDKLLSYVLQRALEDARLLDVAAEIGVHRSALNAALLRHRQEDWQEVQVARALTAVEDAEIDLEEGRDLIAITRANYRLKGAYWRLERLHRRLFGADVATSSGASVVINIGALRQSSTCTESDAQVIDAEGGVTG